MTSRPGSWNSASANNFEELTFSVAQANDSRDSDRQLGVEVLANNEQVEIRSVPFNQVQEFTIDVDGCQRPEDPVLPRRQRRRLRWLGDRRADRHHGELNGGQSAASRGKAIKRRSRSEAVSTLCPRTCDEAGGAALDHVEGDGMPVERGAHVV